MVQGDRPGPGSPRQLEAAGRPGCPAAAVGSPGSPRDWGPFRGTALGTKLGVSSAPGLLLSGPCPLATLPCSPRTGAPAQGCSLGPASWTTSRGPSALGGHLGHGPALAQEPARNRPRPGLPQTPMALRPCSRHPGPLLGVRPWRPRPELGQGLQRPGSTAREGAPGPGRVEGRPGSLTGEETLRFSRPLGLTHFLDQEGVPMAVMFEFLTENQTGLTAEARGGLSPVPTLPGGPG